MKKNKIINKNQLLLICIVALQVICITYIFACKRNDYHSDEGWSFGLANSTDGPYLYMTDDQEYLRNLFVWTDGSVLREYVSVQRGEEFDYGNVMSNLSNDMHPPLYFMLLHTICSFLPDSYSLWYGFLINIAAFVIGQFFFYKMILLMTDSKRMGFAGCILWGGCVGALSVTLFIRLYALSVMFVIILLFLYARMMKNGKFSLKNDILPIAAVTFLGSMTNNFFTLFAFFFTGCFCIYFLCTKRFKTLFVFAAAVLAAQLLVLCIVPNTLTRAGGRVAVSTSGGMRRANYDYQLRWCVYYVTTELFGIISRPYATMTLIYIEYFIAGICFLALFVSYILRKEKWFRRFVRESILLLKKVLLVLYYKIRYIPVCLISMAVSGAGIILSTAYLISIPHMQEHTDRYLCVGFPALSAFALVAVYKIILLFVRSNSKRKVETAALCICVGMVIWNQALFDSPYQFSMQPIEEDFLTNEQVRQLTAGNNCILGLTQGWHLEMAPNYMRDVEQFFAFFAKEYKNMEGPLSEFTENGKGIYFIFNGEGVEPMDSYAGISIQYDGDIDKKYTRADIEAVIKGMDFCEKYEYLGYTYGFGDKYEIYRLR